MLIVVGLVRPYVSPPVHHCITLAEKRTSFYPPAQGVYPNMRFADLQPTPKVCPVRARRSYRFPTLQLCPLGTVSGCFAEVSSIIEFEEARPSAFSVSLPPDPPRCTMPSITYLTLRRRVMYTFSTTKMLFGLDDIDLDLYDSNDVSNGIKGQASTPTLRIAQDGSGTMHAGVIHVHVWRPPILTKGHEHRP